MNSSLIKPKFSGKKIQSKFTSSALVTSALKQPKFRSPTDVRPKVQFSRDNWYSGGLIKIDSFKQELEEESWSYFGDSPKDVKETKQQSQPKSITKSSLKKSYTNKITLDSDIHIDEGMFHVIKLPISVKRSLTSNDSDLEIKKSNKSSPTTPRAPNKDK